MDIIEVKDLTQDYGHGRGVFDVSFSVKEGEVFGFLGPNGAGKSTTIRHIMGFSRPQKEKQKFLVLKVFIIIIKFWLMLAICLVKLLFQKVLQGWNLLK